MELDKIIEESLKIMEEDFYKQKFYFSYSSLNKLLWNPAIFHQIYIMGLKQEKQEAHLTQGKLIHCLLLEKDKFDQQFIVSNTTLPTGNTKTVVDRVFYHHQELKANGDTREFFTDFGDAIIDVLKDINLHQSLKTDQQRLDKVITPEAINYWTFLQSKGNKSIIDKETYDFCQNAVDLIRNDQAICKLLGCNLTEFDNVDVKNEQMLQCDIIEKPFGLRGIVDNLVINHDEKILYINDVKTTSKDLKDFPETIEYYCYWMQAVIYCILVSSNYKNLIDQGYKIKFHFVVIDKNFQTYAFPVREETLNLWLSKLETSFAKAEWHYINKSYNLPYDFAVGKVVL